MQDDHDQISPPNDLLAQLSVTQAAAAAHYTGPALVLAGAGSGKTRTLIYRIAHLIQEYEVDPSSILAVTFTNKAAAEMRERAEKLIGSAAQNLWMSTFHSAGVRILRAYGESIGLRRGFVIFDSDDQLDVIKRIIGGVSGLGADPNPKGIRSIIDQAKNRLETHHDVRRYSGHTIAGFETAAIAEVYRQYEEIKKVQNAVDFNDLIIEVVRLFEEYPDILSKVQSRAQFIHVDEYQDTNAAQYKLTKLLTGENRNLLVVGDPDQSIYKFRGADIQNILDFQKDYEDAKIFKLEYNYRSSAKILKAANKLIENNSQRLEKTLLPIKNDGKPIYYHRSNDGRGEGDFVAERVTKLHREGYALSDMVVLYRTNAQSRQIEESLRRVQLPNKIVGGVGFYDRREIKDILAYARLAVNSTDDVALRRIIGRPKRGIGDVALGKILEWAYDNKTSALQACSHAEQILNRGADKVLEFARFIQDLTEAEENYEPAQFLNYVIESSGYLDMLKAERREGQIRIENLQELVNAVTEWSQENADGTILDFLDDASLLSSVDDMRTKAEHKDKPEDAVTLMTMHNAKGLEFPVVFIVGLEQGILPSRGALVDGDTGREEERRLFYVAITRAMEYLYMSSAENRMQYGKTQAAEDSEFLSDLQGAFEVVDIYGKKVGFYDKAASHLKSSQVSTQRSHFGGGFKKEAHINSNASREQKDYKGGEKVKHPKFGSGQVLAVSGFGGNQEVTVHFDSVGTKKLMLRFANLSRSE